MKCSREKTKRGQLKKAADAEAALSARERDAITFGESEMRSAIKDTNQRVLDQLRFDEIRRTIVSEIDDAVHRHQQLIRRCQGAQTEQRWVPHEVRAMFVEAWDASLAERASSLGSPGGRRLLSPGSINLAPRCSWRETALALPISSARGSLEIRGSVIAAASRRAR